MQKFVKKAIDWFVLKGFFTAKEANYTHKKEQQSELIQYNHQYYKIINPQYIEVDYFNFLKQAYSFNNRQYLLKNAFIHHESGGVLIDKKIFKPSFLNNFWYITSAGVYKYLFKTDKNALKIEKGFLLTGNMTYNFYHFLIDSFPRVIDYLQLKQDNPDLKLILNYPQPFTYDYLKLLDISVKDCIFLDKNAQVQQLYISENKHSLNRPNELYSNFIYSKNQLQQYANFLAQKTQNQLSTTARKREKIYISRYDAGTRVVSNEEELFNYLEKEGFEFIFLSKLSIPEQIQLFLEAKYIITAHGAGLANLIYAKNALIIEFFPCNKNLATLYQMHQLGQVNENKHILFVCNEVTELQDVRVDMQQFQRVWEAEK